MIVMKRWAVLSLISVILLLLFSMPILADENTWVCPDCAQENIGNFCTNCGMARPVKEESWICPDCGTENESRYCTNCGKLSPLEHVHSWGEWELIKEASCTEEGLEQRVCSEDATHVETRSVEKLEHQWIDATYTQPKTCVLCGAQSGNVKGYIGNLDGTWSEERLIIGASKNPIYKLKNPVENILALTVRVKLSDIAGNPYGTWYLFARDLERHWQRLCAIELTDNAKDNWVEYQIPFNGRDSYNAFALAPRYSSSIDDPFEMNIEYTDAQVG